jgi:hypothetical protein
MVYIVVNLECGWDNIVGVFNGDDVSEDHLLRVFPGEEYHILTGLLLTGIGLSMVQGLQERSVQSKLSIHHRVGNLIVQIVLNFGDVKRLKTGVYLRN